MNDKITNVAGDSKAPAFLLVSVVSSARSRRFLASGLRMKKFRSRRPDFERQMAAR